MKKLIALLIILLSLFSNTKSQDFKKHKEILQTIFLESKIVDIGNADVIETTARGKFASIPINSSECYLLELSNNVAVLAFTIYLSDNKEDYKLMEESEMQTIYDIEEGSELKRLKDNQRFIQVVLFDTKNKKFIGKPEAFPLEGLRWLPEGMGDFAEYISIYRLEAISGGNNSCVIQLFECASCNLNTYVFKLIGQKVYSSEKHSGCFENYEESSNKIQCDEIINCYESQYEGTEPQIETKILLQW